ncbi:MAG: hypothetical protein AAF938_03025 [Myxococcota bacterium]
MKDCRGGHIITLHVAEPERVPAFIPVFELLRAMKMLDFPKYAALVEFDLSVIEGADFMSSERAFLEYFESLLDEPAKQYFATGWDATSEERELRLRLLELTDNSHRGDPF